jgi:hypothetical protein
MRIPGYCLPAISTIKLVSILSTAARKPSPYRAGLTGLPSIHTGHLHQPERA